MIKFFGITLALAIGSIYGSAEFVLFTDMADQIQAIADSLTIAR